MTRLKATDWVSSNVWLLAITMHLTNNFPDLQHNLFLLTFDNVLGLAPPNQSDSKVHRVLDVGTGTGIWAIEFAEDHPDAEVPILYRASL